MKNKDLYQIRNNIVKFITHRNSNFSYSAFKNIKKIDEVLLYINNMNEIPIGISKFELERLDICQKMAKKDDEGLPILIDGKYDIDKEKEFEKMISDLEEKYKDDLQKRKDHINNMEEFLNNDCEIEFEKVSREDLPKNMTIEEIMSISFMIN
ncbi:MAG: hypothetical protein KDH96_11950 [Candidatus Riesia sp.]|nr:hypothetical protein [Candidatus Riesia sp.]